MKHKQYPFYSIERLINAFKYSVEGILATFKTEAAFKLEVMMIILLLPIVFVMDFNAVEKVLLVGCLVLVIISELMNTAIEAVVDRISEEKHELSKKAKDVGSAIVLVAFFNAMLTWGIILY